MMEKYVQLLVDSFWEDPGVAFQMKDISNGRRYFELMSKGEVEVFHKLGYVTTYGDGDGMVICYPVSDFQKPETLAALQECGKYLLAEADETSLTQINERAQDVLRISKPDWFAKYTGEKDVLNIQILVIRKEVRGTGLLTKMLEPIFKLSKEKDMRIALQTHNPENLVKYEHYGFEVLEKHSTEDGKLTCYNLLR